ncbi:MAG: alpha-2-macroglobulin family protein [bacterium]
MKSLNIRQKIYTAIILISIICCIAAVSAQAQTLQPFSYPYYISSNFVASIFGNILPGNLYGNYFFSQPSIVPNFFLTPRASSVYPSFLGPYWTSYEETPSLLSPLWASSHSDSLPLLNTSSLGLESAASSNESPSVSPRLIAAPFYSSLSLYGSPYLPFSGLGWPFDTLYLRTGLWAWPATPPTDEDLERLWGKIGEAIENGLPVTAIDRLEEFIPIALEKEKYGLAMKGICKQLVLEANIQGDKPEEKIIRLTEEIENAPDLLKPLLKLVLAQWYWQYYQENRWRFSERDATAVIDESDFTTWDLPRLFDKIDELYTEVLSKEEQLKSMSMETFSDFFEQGTVPVSYRPTLFDFAAFSAISFYQDGDQLRNEPEDAFELDADSDAFAPAADFILYTPETTDTSSPVLKAMKLYQKVLGFHINDSSKEAFVDADINRLAFIKGYSFGEEKSSHYMTRLSEIAETYSYMSLSSLAYYYWAQELYGQDNYVEAHRIAKIGEAQHTGSYGSNMCRSLLSQIEAKEMTLQSEYSVTPSYSEVRIDYRNIDKVHFRVVKDQWDEFLEETYSSPYYIDNDKFQELIQAIPAKSWSLDLEPTIDYKTHSHAIDLPSLEPGYYRLIASWREDFAEDKNAIRIVTFWVTEIAMVTKSIDGTAGGFILDAHSGAPLEGAVITIFIQNSEGNYYQAAVTYTDEKGSFTVPNPSNRTRVLHAKYQGYELLGWSGYTYEREENGEYKRTIFFTDRAIYRPGQMIHFKVLAIKSNQDNDTYDFLPNTSLTIMFRDHNYQEVEHLDLITNAFGSASGTFTAPAGILAGNMTISCSQPSGSTSIRVEEYKRPKFRVTLDPPTAESRLDEEVELSGLAMAYTGAPIDYANVSYRVVREVRYPYWCWWRRYQSSSAREIAHGRLQTDSEGRFHIRFTARPDRSIPESDKPTFIFKVSADVTDGAGETRSASRRVNIGYVSMELNISASDWLTSDEPVELSVSAMTLDQQPLNAVGTITVFDLKQPQRPVRSSLLGQPMGESEDSVDESKWENWPENEAVASSQFNTSEGEHKVSFVLQPGVYKAIATAYDSHGEEVSAVLPIMVIDPGASDYNVPIPDMVKLKSTTLEVGDTLEAIWGTGYQEGHAFIEIEHRGQIVESYWTEAQNTQQKVTWPVLEGYRGGFFLHITQVHDNRAYISEERIDVPWTNKDLEVSFSSFRSKLDPGAEETWTIQIKGSEAEHVAAEMVATLYDSSLDLFQIHNWSGLGSIFRQDYSSLSIWFANNVSYPRSRTYEWNEYVSGYISRTYTRFPDDVIQNYGNYGYPGYYYGYGGGMYGYSESYSSYSYNSAQDADGADKTPAPPAYGGETAGSVEEPEEEIDLSQVSARTNLDETAFFFPHLLTDEEGRVSITFTIPEALTTWKFMGFAHARDLLWGMLSEETVTKKDLMVQPNPPRFFREGDILLFSAKVTNISDQGLNGTIRLTLSDASTGQSLDNEFQIGQPDQSFSVPANSSRSYYWEIEVPDDFTGALTHRVVASTGTLSDGEEACLPVLSNRIFVTESLPLPIRGAQTKIFSFDKLLESDASDTLEHQALTLQMVSNPAWYAVQSLPYLIEYQHECSTSAFNRLYANALARHIANSDPEIKSVFDQWRETDALDSNLEKNEELKSVLLEETPWVRAAESESEAKRRVGLLFDEDQMETSLSSAYYKLSQMQRSDGAWSWFPGGPANFYMTLYIMTGFGRLRHMNIDIQQDLAIRSLDYLDNSIKDRYEKIKQYGHPELNNLTSIIAMYLYGRSFYKDIQPIPDDCQEAVYYFLGQAAVYWLDLNSRLSQGHLALACNRFNDPVTANKIMASLKERSVSDEELGMFWRDLELSWWWFHAPIETQAVMIEAFDEVADDQTAVEDLKVWLLKQKQTQNWKTSKATADAVYALLLRGENLLASDQLVNVTLGDMLIVPETTEAGTGFYEKKFIREEVLSDYGQVTVEKLDDGIAWGSLHWQYLEDMSKVTPHEDTPLQLEKSLYVERQTTQGPVIEPVQGNLAVGDKIIVRIILRSDRDMEYVHMKDYRGSGTEPVNVLSQYKYQDGLAYYESTRDTATHFFIDYLPKGTYVFEYALRIQHKGEYQMGMASIQCMYAPEFNSHSASEFITVQ